MLEEFCIHYLGPGSWLCYSADAGFKSQRMKAALGQMGRVMEEEEEVEEKEEGEGGSVSV